MRISLEWLADFVSLPEGVTPAGLAHQLTSSTVEVEDVIDTGAPLAGVVVGHVESVTPIPGRARFAVSCRVGPDRTVGAVSGADNLVPGLAVAVALPAQSTMDTLGRRGEAALRTAADLGLERMFPASGARAVLELSGIAAPAGTALATALGLDDAVLDIDNKSLTNRPDLWGHYGIARELAAIYRVPLAPLPGAGRPPAATGLVADLDPDICRRFVAVAFDLPDPAGPAPLWLRSRLARVGQASVDLCTDLSTYVMLAVGQPTQLYDADRITLPLSVRAGTAPSSAARQGGANEDCPVVADAGGPVAVAGVAGGGAPAAHGATTRFVLEAATFRPLPVRRASQRLGLRTEASARFEKGLDTQRVDAAVGLYLHLLGRLAPAARVTAIQDADLDPTRPARIDVGLDFLARRIGTALEPGEIRRILTGLAFGVEQAGDRLEVTVPTWRSTGDVSLPHDIVEEVARVHGYDALPASPLSVALHPVRGLRRRPVDRVVREQLAARAGMREVVTYPWAGDALLAAAGMAKERTVRFTGAPAPDRDSLRPSLVPNLIEATAANLRYAEEFAIFEVGTVFRPARPVPAQPMMLAGIVAGRDGTVFRVAKGILEMLAREAHLGDLGVMAPDGRLDECGTGPAAWADRSARAALTAGGTAVGTLALLTKRSRRLAGIDAAQVACFELDLDRLSPLASRHNRFEALPALPEADFDLSVVVGDDVPWARMAPVVTGADPLVHRVSFLDEFRGSWVPDGHRSVSLRATLRATGTTLTAQAIGVSRQRILDALAEGVGARLRD